MTRHATRTSRSKTLRRAEANQRFPYQASIRLSIAHKERKVAALEQKIVASEQELRVLKIKRNIAIIEQNVEQQEVAVLEEKIATYEHNIEIATIEQDITVEELSMEVSNDEDDSTTPEQNVTEKEEDVPLGEQNTEANLSAIVRFEKLLGLLLVFVITHKYYGVQSLRIVSVAAPLLSMIHQRFGRTSVLVAVVITALVYA